MIDAPPGGRPASGGGKLRLGVVSYVNAWPLLRGLEGRPDVDLVTATPAAVATLLAEGRVDAGLVPSIELLRQTDLAAIGGVGISAFGTVDSVLLLLRRAPHRVRTLALDAASRTSQVLAALVLEHVYGVSPEVVSDDPERAWSEGCADAVLVIGDRALDFREAGAPAIDLAEAWTRWTGLPFVFAAFCARKECAARHDAIAALLRDSLARGLRDLESIARRAAERGPLDAAGFQVYLTRRIRYGLGELEMRGLRKFLDLARCST